MSTASGVVKEFFANFGRGDFEAIVGSFHPQAVIEAVRKGDRSEGRPYGSYSGVQGAREFISGLGKTFDTKAFAVDHVVGEGDVAFASGSFTHVVRTTGKTFSSEWALMCVVKDGKIAVYRFYEDSAAFERAAA